MRSSCLLLIAAFSSLTEGALPSCFNDGEFETNTDYFDSIKFQPMDYSLIIEPSAADLFTDNKVETDISTDQFSISYHDHYKILTNHFVNVTYLLYLCGTKDAIPEEELDGRHHLVLSVPHTGGVAVTETTQIPFLELLGVRRDMIAYIGDPQWVSSPCMKRMMEKEQSIEVVFNEGEYNAILNQALIDAFVQENPDAIVFGGPYGNKDGERTVIAAATQERTTVATFDWIGFYAAFFNLEGMSNKIATDTKARFDCISSNAATLYGNRSLEERPTVLWATYFSGYNWSVVQCPTWNSAYYCEYAQHCGAQIISRPEDVGTNNGGFWYLNDEELAELGKDADFFVFPSTTWDSVYEEKKDVLDQIKAVRNKQVFDSQGPGPNAWFEQRLAEYDVVALDFCSMVGSTGADATHERQWLRNVFTDPVGSLPECKYGYLIDQPYTTKGGQCALLASAAVAWSGVAVTFMALLSAFML